jgi:FkbM family methyltransferase
MIPDSYLFKTVQRIFLFLGIIPSRHKWLRKIKLILVTGSFGMFNPCHERIIRKYVHRGDVVIDCGANRGDYCRKFLNRGAIVHAFEPGTVFRELYTKFHSEPNIHLYGIAVGGNEPVELLEYAGTGQSTVDIPRNDGAGVVVYSHTVESTQIDDLDLAPAFIKVDCEGMDFGIIRGAELTLRAHHPVVLIENNTPLFKQRGIATSDILEYMSELGYRYEMIEGGVGDILFIPKEKNENI